MLGGSMHVDNNSSSSSQHDAERGCAPTATATVVDNSSSSQHDAKRGCAPTATPAGAINVRTSRKRKLFCRLQSACEG